MPNQLAPNTVRTYRLSPEGYKATRKIVSRYNAVLSVGTILFALVLTYKMFGQTWHQNLMASLLPAVVVVLCLCGPLAIGWRNGMKRSQESWDSFELLIGEDFVIRKRKNFPDLEIHRNEVTRIKESALGLRVETKLKGHTIGIARALIDYEDARERLSRWMPLVHVPQNAWTSATRWIWISPVITIVLFALCVFSTNSWLVLTTGVPLVIGLSLSIWFTRRRVQASAQMKRLSLFTVLPLLAIIAKVIQAIQRLR